MSTAYYLELPLCFPEGVQFGAGKMFNRLAITRDGQGDPVLNGTSVAGMMRGLWRDYLHAKLNHPVADSSDNDPASTLFGTALDRATNDIDGLGESGIESCVKVTNYRLDFGDTDAIERTHHHRNRHRGTVVQKGLFCVESCPPGTSANVGIWVLDQGDVIDEEIEELLSLLNTRFDAGLFMGGNSNRGIGRVTLAKPPTARRFDLTNLQQQADYLIAHRQWRKTGRVEIGQTIDLPTLQANDTSLFSLSFTLGIPRGQDVLVADGQGTEVQLEPQMCPAADGNAYWRIPGASLRGLFRAWFHRLAAQDAIASGTTILLADSAADYPSRENSTEPLQQYLGDNIAVGFVHDASKAPEPSGQSWPIVNLFGDLRNRGRIKISDAVTPCSKSSGRECPESQDRVHVSVDRVTGGAAKGMLFSNRVLTNTPERDLKFSFQLRINEPEKQEVDWLARTLIALHLGILRVGSSKSSGRLELVEVPKATGENSSTFNERIRPLFGQA